MVSAACLLAAWLRTPRRIHVGLAGWTGCTVLSASLLLLTGSGPKPVFLVPLAWSGYALAVDAGVYSIRGHSLLRSRPEAFVWLAALSIFLWMPFEWFNLRLAGWYHAGLPAGPFRYLLLGWSFTCIWPALFETADLILAVAARHARCRKRVRSARLPVRIWPAVLAGAVCLLAAPLVPRLDFGEHLLALTAVGFLLLLDPLNLRLGRSSLWRNWIAGHPSRIAALMLSGAFCGLQADLLNYGADAKWYFISRFGGDLRVFELPLAAYLVLPLFGLQAFAMYVFAASGLGLPLIELPSPSSEGTAGGPAPPQGAS